ncbi:general substrate transporter [Saccharata proteae CBS 121410]|uniref:General substrate transporter n=1 Tax=Saccharata proteae CBS 121410 TaxID=1314787 RepID=A0A6A5YCY7_9PEZI|nr:general substrate transporter [Saccharata proteae CBS 121410]
MQLDLFGRGWKLQLAITAACSMAFVLFGYDQGVFSGIVGNEDFLEIVNHPNDTILGIIVSTYNLGCFTGCILTFCFGEYFGRRRAMWIAMGWVIVGAALQASAYSQPHIIIARFVTGIGTGIETSTVPMYQAELSQAHNRGRLVCSEPLFVGVGIVTAYWFDYGMNFVSGPIAWRLPIACQVIFAFVVIVLVFGLPDSPRDLYNKGRDADGLKVLCDVFDKKPDEPSIVEEVEGIKQALRLEGDEQTSWLHIFRQDEVQTGKRVLLAYGMQFMNQVGGINLVVYYVPTVLHENVGMTRNMSLLIGGVIQIMFPLGSIIPALGSDKLGRRRPMVWGSLGLGICMMMVAVMLSFKGSSIEKPTSDASVAFFFIYMFIFGATVNCIPWVYVPEILPLRARARGTAIGISSNWLWNFVIVMITPVIIGRLQWKAYLIFMCTNLLFVPLVYFCYPETANLTLEEMDLLYTDRSESPIKISKRIRKEKKLALAGRRLPWKVLRG